MKEIKSREEYGQLVNFGKYPVLMVDMNQKGFMGEIFEGSKVRVDFGYYNTGERKLDNGTLCYFKKENQFYIRSEVVCLSKDFPYEDAIEQAQFGNAPIINDGDEVVIILHNSEDRTLRAFLVKAINKNEFCSTSLEFE